MSAKSSARPARPWYVDGLTAGAFFFQALVLGRWLRMVPPAAFFVFTVSAGAGWFFARSAWRGLLDGRK